MTETNSSNSETPFPKWKINLLGSSYIILIILLGLLVYYLWPEYEGEENTYVPVSKFLWTSISLSLEHRIILLVLITGAIGSFVHSAGSFSNFVGENKLHKNWTWWYILRPFIGMAVAFVIYLVFRGGLLTDTNAEGLNLYGILSLSALSGMFSDRATLKLKEIFDSMFQPKDQRTGKLENEEDTDFNDQNSNG